MTFEEQRVGDSIAHDLRNCLYLSASFAQLLRDGLGGPVTDAQREYLEHILDCASRGQALLGVRS